MPVCQIVDRLVMGLMSSRRKLEAQRIKRQHIEDEIQVRRQQALHDDMLLKEQERRREDLELKGLERRDEEAKVLETKLAEGRDAYRRRGKLAGQESVERPQMQQEIEPIESERVENDEGRREQERQNKLRQASPETLRDLRELIRSRHELDVKIWALRNVRRPDRPIVEAQMEQADAIMDRILLMVELWGDNNDARWSAEEWAKVEIIRKKIRDGGFRSWAENPPWD